MSAAASIFRRAPWRLIGFLALCGVLMLGLATRHNRFPFTYHPDEEGKVKQILTGKRNYFHPLLALGTTRLAMTVCGVEKTPENAAVAGRTVMATFTAIAVVAMALLAFRWTGWLGGGLTGFLLIFSPALFELAHYFKEDPALLMGLALSFLALDVFWKRPTPWSAAFLGLANALAMSGKYIGVVVLLFSLPVVFARRDPRWLLARWFALGWLVPLILVNLSLLRHFSTFESGLSREVDGATRGHRGLGREVPHIYYFLRMPFMTPWGLWAGLIAATAAVAWRWKRITVPQWAAIAFPIFFLCLLSFSPKTAGRYLLPVEAFAVLLAGTGMAMLIQSGAALRWPWKAVAVAGASVALIAAMSTWTMFGVYWNEFATDSRADLRQWITANLPAEAIIAQDDRVDLEADPSWRSRKVLSSEYAADVGSIEELRRRGVTHVAITTQIYNRFLDESIRPTEEARPNFERRAAFYKRILNSGNPVWEQKSGLVIYLHPTLRLFELPSK